MADRKIVHEDPEVLALLEEDKGLTLELRFSSQVQAEEFVALGTPAGERIALDLEDAEVRAWFDDPGHCTSEITFPSGTMDLLVTEMRAARSVGAEAKVTLPGGNQ